MGWLDAGLDKNERNFLSKLFRLPEMKIRLGGEDCRISRRLGLRRRQWPNSTATRQFQRCFLQWERRWALQGGYFDADNTGPSYITCSSRLMMCVCVGVCGGDAMFLVHELGGAYNTLLGRGSDSLRAGRYGFRIPVEARFSAPSLGPTQPPT